MKTLFPLAFFTLLLSCKLVTNSSPDAENALGTGLQGRVLRGPITPVCRVDEPCDAPFSAWFSVLKEGREVSRFKSDANGQFSVALAPDTYVIVPDASAPIMDPLQQAKEVEVKAEGMTQVTLYFDTGIR